MDHRKRRWRLPLILSLLLVAVSVLAACFPALPPGSALVSREDYESGTVGSHYSYPVSLGSCDATNNKVINDPNHSESNGVGMPQGKVLEMWWDPGDQPKQNHGTRCEDQQQPAVDGAGEYVYRTGFIIKNDSYLPSGTNNEWMYVFQFHGSSPSTSPPITGWVTRDTDPSKFRLNFKPGDSSGPSHLSTPLVLPRESWIPVQVHVNWNGENSWVEYHVRGEAVTVAGGGTRRAFSMRVSQGLPSGVYAKWGIDGGGTPSPYGHQCNPLPSLCGELTGRPHVVFAGWERYKVN